MLRILIPTLLIALAPLAARAQSCSQADIRQAVDALAPARTTLLAFPIRDDFDPAVAPAARDAIAEMKTRLAQLAAAYMRCAPAGVDVKTVQRDLSDLMHAGAPKGGGDARYGDMIAVTAERTVRNLFKIDASFNIKCATDDVVSIFAHQTGGWRERMRVQYGRYKDVSDATGGLTVEISPPDAAGHWFAVTTSVAPWCSSNWSEIRYAVLRPSSRAAAPRTIFSAKDSIFREDQDGKLRVGADNFDLRFPAESVDDAAFTRERVRHFSVVGDSVRRIAPFANRPRDFAEEWIVSPWADARQWTTPGTRLENLHARLARKKTGLEYLSIRKCGARTQIELQPYDSDTIRYFLLVLGDRDFAMENVSNRADPRCTGKNLYDPDHPN
jgi:hypothetical protein